MTSTARLFNHFLAALWTGILGWAIFDAAPAVFAQSSPDRPTVDSIVAKALQRNQANLEADAESGFTFRVFSVQEKLAKDGSVEEKKTKLYQVIPMQGASFDRLLEEDGVPLTQSQSAEEDRRQRKFREKLRRGEKPDEGRQEVAFDENLVAKYDFSLLGSEELRGRTAYLLGYKPKSGDLPVRNRMDQALNKAEGKIWIDARTYEVARVEFELKEKVSLWWGLIGNISELEGRVERVPVGSGVWLPESVDIYLNGRILFTSLHRRQSLRFSDFREFAADAAEARQSGP